MEFGELKQEDIDFVAEHSISRGVLSKQPQEIDFSYALRHNGKVLAIGGIRLINATTAWAWGDLTTYAHENIKTVYRVGKEWMNELVKIHKIKRLQAYIEVDFDEAIRFIEHLGFHQESIMPNFVGNKSAYLYVKYFGE